MIIRHENRAIYVFCAVLIALNVSKTSVFADGFRNPPEGGFALGSAGGESAFVEDASAVSHNPAGLTAIDKPQVLPSVTFGYSKKRFTNELGQSTETENDFRVLPALYGAWPSQKTEGLVHGLGLTFPFGQSSKWERNGPLKFIAPYSGRLTTSALSYVLSYKVNDQLSIGGGLVGYASALSFKQDFPWGAVTGNPMTRPGTAEVDTLGFGLGITAGAQLKVGEKQRLALAVRSPFSISYEGDFEISNLPDQSTLPPPARGATARSDASTDIDFPTIVTLGYGIQLTETLRLSSDVEWLQFSEFESLNVDLENNTFLLPNNGRSAQDWEDTVTYGLAVNWDVSDTLNARAGFVWLPTPVPSQTLSPSFADDDHPVYTAGLGYSRGEDSVIDVGVALGVYDTRRVTGNNNPAYNGEYDIENFLVTVSWSKGF